MNTLTLQMRVKNEEGALLRVLSMTRRRRFDLISLEANSSHDRGFLDVCMTVRAERSLPAFIRQIEKLVDVAYVEVVKSGHAETDARAAASVV